MAGITPPPSARRDVQARSASSAQADTPVDAGLNTAILDFAPRFMKEKLERLVQQCDERLERTLVPQLHHLLRQIDDERQAFEQQKEQIAHELHNHLTLLRFDDHAVASAIRQLVSVESRYLHLLPAASSLTGPLSLVGSEGRISDDTTGPVGEIDAPIANATASLSLMTPVDAIRHKSASSATPPSNCESEVQAQVTAESAKISLSPKKRTRPDKRAEGSPIKRQKNGVPQTKKDSAASSTEAPREIAFPNLETGECIFRHGELKGYFVIRCDHCDHGPFTEPPLQYNRALKHFQKHNFVRSDGDELTNEDIFEKFAYRVYGEEMASKYWIREHLTANPHTFVPTKAAKPSLSTEELEENMLRKHKEIDDDFYPPFPTKMQESPSNPTSDQKEEVGKPRRPMRNVPRPDYKEMIAGKDPWDSLAEIDSERTVTTIQVTQTSSSSKRRVVKAEGSEKHSTKPKANEPKKPFGYSEPWPRRSAPR